MDNFAEQLDVQKRTRQIEDTAHTIMGSIILCLWLIGFGLFIFTDVVPTLWWDNDLSLAAFAGCVFGPVILGALVAGIYQRLQERKLPTVN